MFFAVPSRSNGKLEQGVVWNEVDFGSWIWTLVRRDKWFVSPPDQATVGLKQGLAG